MFAERRRGSAQEAEKERGERRKMKSQQALDKNSVSRQGEQLCQMVTEATSFRR